MRRIICLLIFLIASIGVDAIAADQTPIELKAVQFVYIGSTGQRGFHLFVDRVNKACSGELTIKIAGGPESIPATQQVEAVRGGAVDVAMVPSSWYANIVPVAAVMNLSKLEPWDQRKSGFHDYLVQEHRKEGIHFIGVGNVGDPFYLYAREKIGNPTELKGKRFRHSPTYPFFKDFGMIPITTSQSDMYTGLERNLFVGVANKHDGFIQNNLFEVCKFVIGPGFWPYSGNVILMNEKRFSGLPKRLQGIILRAQEEAEPVMKDIQEKLNIEAWGILKKNGVTHVEWSREDAASFLDKINEITWLARTKNMPPDVAARVKKMMGY
jgi:TRAP-type C4-dicarboxylate transport system substrate-binding protein